MSTKEHHLKIAAFPGSFDPIHAGHINIIKRAAKLFDQLYVIVSYNHIKKQRESLAKRYQLTKQTIDQLDLKNVKVIFNKKE
jgi:pantetheine-phosphate adenylyltransferase